MDAQVSPEQILQVGMGFMASQTLLSAVELGLFTELAHASAGDGSDLAALSARLGLHPRSARDFLDTLVVLGFLQRSHGRYANAPATEAFLVRGKSSYIGGILEMAHARLYGFWGSLTTALRTGEPQNEGKGGGDTFATLYAEPARLRGFLQSMTGISHGANLAIARQFPWDRYRTFTDVGAAQGDLAAQICLANPHLAGTGFDLPQVGPIFTEYVARHGLEGRLRFAAGSFFTDPLPGADVITMGHILHDWSLAEKQALIAKAHAALNPGGALVIYDAIIDDDRSANAFGLLMSLNMLVETAAGFDYTGADCTAWMQAAGFHGVRVEHLTGPDSMVIGFK